MNELLVRDTASGMYVANSSLLSEEDVLAAAEEILKLRMMRGDDLRTLDQVKRFLQVRLGARLSEVFAVVFMDSSLRVLAYEELFFGTISMATVHYREVVRRCIHHNAAVIVVAHNHPSGNVLPSMQDIEMTAFMNNILKYVDVQLHDHIVVGDGCTSFTESGLMPAQLLASKKRRRSRAR